MKHGFRCLKRSPTESHLEPNGPSRELGEKISSLLGSQLVLPYSRYDTLNHRDPKISGKNALYMRR